MTKFYRETQFKDTEIGRIPEDWEVVRLGEVAKVSSGNSAPQGKEYFNNGKFPFIRVQHINSYRNLIEEYDLINEKAVEDYKLTKFPKGSIILPKSGASIFKEKRAILPFDAYVVSHLAVIMPREAISNLFLFYILSNRKLSRFKSSKYPSINLSELERLPIPLPPIEEQRAIAGVLRQFDELVEVIDKKIESLQRIKKGLMDVYFTRGVFEHREFKETEIGRIPEDWEVVRLGEIGEIITGKTPSTKIKEYWNGDIMFVTPTDYKGRKYIDSTERYLTKKGADKSKIIPPNSVLVVSIASIGEVVINTKSCVTNQQINAVVPDGNKANYEYLYYVMKHRSKYLKLIAGFTTTPIVKKSTFEKFSIPLPPIEEQKEIARRLKDVDDQIENLREQRERVERMKKRVMDLLLTGKVRVKEV